MLKNFRNSVLAPLVLLAFVGYPMALHANTLTCTNIINGGPLGISGVSPGAMTSGTCIKVGDNLMGNFSLGNLPPRSAIAFYNFGLFSPFAILIFFENAAAGGPFVPGTTYHFGYQVQLSNSFTGVRASINQSEGRSGVSATLTPAGRFGTIDFTQSGVNVVSGSNIAQFTPSITDLTVENSFNIGAHSNAIWLEYDFGAVPEPSALEGLLLGTGVLGLVEMARRKLKLGT